MQYMFRAHAGYAGFLGKMLSGTNNLPFLSNHFRLEAGTLRLLATQDVRATLRLFSTISALAPVIVHVRAGLGHIG
jgi:hypothetical protein